MRVFMRINSNGDLSIKKIVCPEKKTTRCRGTLKIIFSFFKVIETLALGIRERYEKKRLNKIQTSTNKT